MLNGKWAWRVVLDAGFLRVCPIQPHFLCRICLATGPESVGSVSLTEMLYRTNILAIVGGGNYPKFDEKAVLIWDESKRSPEDKIVLDITFAQPVLGVRLLKDK
nr:hypothetical protein BaRGS_024906 [Batillaria attramentaria]